jgi:predicted RNA-binding protein with RPS1 domain
MQEKLTNTTTGPKLWLDVGVCRWSTKSDPQGAWTICTAMLRLGRANYQKESVLRKKVARLRSKNVLTLYVSRIRLEQGQFEVVLTPEEIPPRTKPKLQAVSQLNVGDEVTGTVVRLEDYGVLIQMDGYNRHGLLHIQRVADLYHAFIDKQSGLIEAGLDLKSRLKLQVTQKDAKRVFLDFTEDVKRIAIEELEQEEKEAAQKQNQLREQLQRQREASGIGQPDKQWISSGMDPKVDSLESSTVSLSIGTGKVEGNELYEIGDDEEYDGSEDNGEYDNYDEERDIEDALGLGTY